MAQLYWPQAILIVWILQAAVFQGIDMVRGLRRAARRRARRRARGNRAAVGTA